MAKRKKYKRRPSPLRSLLRGVYRLLVLCSALIVAAYGGYRFTSRQPSQTIPLPGQSIATDDPDTEEDESQGLRRKDKTWTFLLAAEDQSSGSTDTIMVCTYDTVNQTIGLVSLPRDTLVDRTGWSYHKLNASYTNGNFYDPPDGGIRELKAAVSELLGIPIDHYVIINTRIFVDLVNAVGGVDFNVPIYMNYDAPDQDLHIHYQPGLQHLNGQQALEVVRCRKNSDGPGTYPDNLYDAYPDADIGRTRTQQEMVKTILKKVLSTPTKVGSYVELFADHVTTDLSLGNLLWFVEPVLSFSFDDLTTATLPGDGTASYKGISVYELDIDGTLSVINQCLNPYTTPVTRDMVQIKQAS